MDELTCPKCHAMMTERVAGGVVVHQCPQCEGVFLDRAELGNLVDAEIDWHRGTGPATQPIPRISEDMTAPPRSSRPSARSYIETLFG